MSGPVLSAGDAEINQAVPAFEEISKSGGWERQVEKPFSTADMHIVYEIRLPTWSSGSLKSCKFSAPLYSHP